MTKGINLVNKLAAVDGLTANYAPYSFCAYGWMLYLYMYCVYMFEPVSVQVLINQLFLQLLGQG